MYLSHLRLSLRDRETRRALADCHAMHAALLAAFGVLPPGVTDARAHFGLLYRMEPAESIRTDDTPLQEPHVTVLAQSVAAPDWSRVTERWRGCDVTGPKPVAERYDTLVAGQSLAFRLRANPTKKRSTPQNADGVRATPWREFLATEKEQRAWLERKATAGGFALLTVRTQENVPDVRLTESDRQRGRPLGTDRQHRLNFGSVTYEGRLRVTDAARLRETLRIGVGSGKAYGFGLLSVAPVW